MISNNYEKAFINVKKAQATTDKLETVLSVLRSAEKPMTCKEIGIAIMGEGYKWGNQVCETWDGKPYYYKGRSQEARRLSSFIGRTLSILAKKGFVKSEQIDGEPITINKEVWVDNSDGEPRMILVHDDKGNEYNIENPRYDWRNGNGHYENKLTTIIPKIKIYSWVGE